MKVYPYIVCLLTAVLLCGCGAKKKVVSTEPTVSIEPEVPLWHTCVIQGANIVVETEEDRLSANANMQVVRDSMLIISVMPMLGIEMLRIEATPLQITAIDKVHGRYAVATYSEINNRLTPSLNWDVLQQICSAELPTGSQKARMRYSFGSDIIDLAITYPERQLDVPVRMTNARLDKYTQIDISKWL